MNRKVIKITAWDSPNVQLAEREIAEGRPASGRQVLPGVLSWAELQHRLATWDEERKSVGLKAEFYKGPQQWLFPEEWLDAAVARHRTRPKPGELRWMGIDPAEGGDRSAWCIIDLYGILFQASMKTPNTNVVYSFTKELMQRWNVEPERVIIDRATGKQHADRLLMDDGIRIRTLSFGETLSLPVRSGMNLMAERREVKEDQTIYKNRRIEMYWEASDLFNPALQGEGGGGFAIPPDIAGWKEFDRKSLRQQLQAIPREYDEHGRPTMRKKNPQAGKDRDDLGSKRVKSLVEILSHSPDEADAFVLALHCMLHKQTRAKAGAV